jgi:hypothetical protein
MIDEHFLPAQHRDMVIVESDPRALLAAFQTFVPVTTLKWL